VKERTPSITAYRNGPYLIRGDFTLLDQQGNEIPTSRATVALCRCGRSRMRPFCDGTHKLTGFVAEGGVEGSPHPPDRATHEASDSR
jgi:CDGSH-type Zn-finger protein